MPPPGGPGAPSPVPGLPGGGIGQARWSGSGADGSATRGREVGGCGAAPARRMGLLGLGTSPSPCLGSSSCCVRRWPGGLRSWWTPRWGSAATRQPSSPSIRSSRSSGWTATRRRSRSPGDGSPPTPTARTSCTPSTTRSPTSSRSWGFRGSTASCSTSASPRCSSTPTSGASPTPATPTSTCGWTRSRGPTAADVLNTYPVPELARVLREYGEERFAARIAAAVGRRRAERPFQRSGDLVELLYATVPAASRRTGGHPAKRTFQALADRGQRRAGGVDGRAARRARTRCAWAAGSSCWPTTRSKTASPSGSWRSGPRRARPMGLPVELPGHGPSFRLLVRGPEQADDDEVADNPRAASVRLRAAERIGEGDSGMAGGTT